MSMGAVENHTDLQDPLQLRFSGLQEVHSTKVEELSELIGFFCAMPPENNIWQLEGFYVWARSHVTITALLYCGHLQYTFLSRESLGFVFYYALQQWSAIFLISKSWLRHCFLNKKFRDILKKWPNVKSTDTVTRTVYTFLSICLSYPLAKSPCCCEIFSFFARSSGYWEWIDKAQTAVRSHSKI